MVGQSAAGADTGLLSRALAGLVAELARLEAGLAPGLAGGAAPAGWLSVGLAGLEGALDRVEDGLRREGPDVGDGLAPQVEAAFTRLERLILRLDRDEALHPHLAAAACPLHVCVLQRAFRLAFQVPAVADGWAWHRIPRVRQYFAARYPDRRFVTTFDDSLRLHASLGPHRVAGVLAGGAGGDRGQVRLIKRLLRPDDVFIDVGANVGVFSLLAARRVPDGEVHAFEPGADHSARLRENVRLNGAANVVQNQVALGREAGEATLHIPRTTNTGMASLYHSMGDQVEHDTETVRITTLDAYVQERRPRRIDLIKIDVEGAELDVLEGGVLALQTHRPDLTMEVVPAFLTRAGRSAADLLAFLHGLGYTVYRVELSGALVRVAGPPDLLAHQNIYSHWYPRESARHAGGWQGA